MSREWNADRLVPGELRLLMPIQIIVAFSLMGWVAYRLVRKVWVVGHS